jgi:hypothetical protein
LSTVAFNFVKVFENITHGDVPIKQPENCPNEIFSIITKCINIEAEARPSFTEVNFDKFQLTHQVGQRDKGDQSRILENYCILPYGYT